MECIIHTRKYVSQKGSNSKRLGAYKILFGNKNLDFNMKSFGGGHIQWYTQGQQTSQSAEVSLANI